MNPLINYIRAGYLDSASSIVATFRQRVLADSGTFESEGYLINWLKQNRDLYNRASFLLTPNGYKAGTLYSFKGQDYNTFTRAGNATRINSAFNQQLMANNVPRIDYEHNTPTFLTEISTTNLWHNNQTQTITVVSGRRYALSFFGTGTVEVTGALTATVVGTSNTVKSLTVFSNALTSGTSVTLTVTGDVFWGNFNLSSVQTNTGTVVNSVSQPTSHIPTVDSNVTRVFDDFNYLSLDLFSTPFMIYIDYISTENRFAFSGAGMFDITSSLSSSSVSFTVGNAIFVGATPVGGGLQTDSPQRNNYGSRQRLIAYFDPSTNTIQNVFSINVDGTWLRLRSFSATIGSFPTDLNRIRIANSIFQGRGSYKFKNISILKDFTGISNIQAYMQALSLRPSI
jgi:hypothetical protein